MWINFCRESYLIHPAVSLVWANRIDIAPIMLDAIRIKIIERATSIDLVK